MPDPASSTSADSRLVRAIGPWSLATNAVNLAVGAGIFALPAVVAGILGPAAILAYLVCGVLVGLVLACFAEVGSRVTRSGGAIAYVDEAFGPLAGFLTWAALALAWNVVADAAILHVLLDALAAFVPMVATGPVRIGAMALIVAALTIVNVRGVRHGTHVVVAVTVAKLVPLLLVIVLGVGALRWDALRWTEWPSLEQVGGAALVLFFAFAGMESSLTPSGEIRDPARTVPRGILGGAGALVVLYLALQVTAQGVLGDELAKQGQAPLAAVADRVAGGAGRVLILACTVLAVFGAVAGDFLGVPRGFLAAAESGMLPAVLTRVHERHRTPWVAIVTFGVLIFAVATTGSFKSLAVLGSIALLLVYLAVCLAALRLRYLGPAPAGAFRAPGGPLVPVLASTSVLWLLSHSTLPEVLGMGTLLLLATLYYALRTTRRRAVVAGD